MIKLKIALGLLVAAVAFAAWRLGLFSLVTRPEELRASLLELGSWGYVAYVGVFALLTPIGLPGLGLVVASAYVWPRPIAFGLSLLGAMLASIIGFTFSRFIARDWVSARLPDRFKSLDKRVGDRGFVSVFLLRIVVWMNPFAHALLGISEVRFRHYLGGTFSAYVLVIAGLVWMSGSVLDFISEQPRERLIGIGVGLALAWAIFWIARRLHGLPR